MDDSFETFYETDAWNQFNVKDEDFGSIRAIPTENLMSR